MWVRSSVGLVKVCLELSIFIILTQIVNLTSYELQAVSQQSFNGHLVSHYTVGALNTSSYSEKFIQEELSVLKNFKHLFEVFPISGKLNTCLNSF